MSISNQLSALNYLSYLMGWYFFASLFTFGVYLRDKWAAKSARWRTRESTLHLLAIVGGWPGAWMAHRLINHKSRKPSFRMAFWVTVAINCAALVGVFYLIHRA